MSIFVLSQIIKSGRHDSAGLSGIYLAWLADANPGNAPNIRFNQATAPYKLTDFTELAADWTHLTCWPSYRTD